MRLLSVLLALAATSAGCSLLYPFNYGASPSDVPDARGDRGPSGDALADAHPDAPSDAPSADEGEVGAPPCPAGFSRCDGRDACIDLRSNVSRCGACGNVCALANATPLCVTGACAVASCNPGFGDCDGSAASGCETNTASALAHCGRCGAACAPPNATGACVDSVCRVMACAAGHSDCDGDASNGCETDTRVSATHCGGCGMACTMPGGVASCEMGRCRVTCSAGRGDCDGNVANGCETDTTASTSNCGACGAACGSRGGTASCEGGRCRITCAAGRADCDVNVGTGCEVDTTADPDHCNGCRRPCSSGLCSASACVTACAAGEVNCGGRCTRLAGDPINCGGCGRVCPTAPNSSGTCTGGGCGVACNSGWLNCDGDAVNGCEVNTNTSLAHCGGCGRGCAFMSGASRCQNGVCEFTGCSPGFGNCDGNVANGCEANLSSSTAHCGRCSGACAAANASTACAMGVCSIAACVGRFLDCNGNVSDGCEVDAQGDTSNCGRCGNRCALSNVAVHTCASGACGVGACNTNFADCDRNPANGCEVDVRTSSAHCGRCASACAGTCSGGLCALEVDCGSPDQACCNRDLQCTDSVCVNETCQRDCGSPGQPCCRRSECARGAICAGVSLGVCMACGLSGQVCCRDDGGREYCLGGLACAGGIACR